MTYLTVVRHVRHWSKEMMPALVVLFVTIAFYVYFGDITFVKGWEEGIYKVLLRFFRFTLLLCLSLYILLPVYRFIVDKIGGRLLQMEQEQGLQIDPMKHWFFRPRNAASWDSYGFGSDDSTSDPSGVNPDL